MVYKTLIEKEYYTEEQCHIIEIMNNAQHPKLSIARARVEPGMTTKVHKLNGTAEYYYVLEGKGEVFIEEDFVQIVEPGDVVYIGENMNQSIKNLGDKDLIFLCICSPRFLQENYVS